MEFRNHIRSDSGRCDAPENTMERVRDGFAKLGLSFVWESGLDLAGCIFWARLTNDPGIGVTTNGKGMTPQLTEASAYAEFAERFSWPSQWQSLSLGRILSSSGQRLIHHHWLRGHTICHQDDLAEDHLCIEDLLADRTYLDKQDIEEIKRFYLCQHWVDGYSLLQEKRVKVPFLFAEYIDASNGLAAGNSLEEAAIQASCEIFERYASREVLRGAPLPTIELDSITDPAAAAAGSGRSPGAASCGIDAYRDMSISAVERAAAFFRENNVDVIFKDMSLGGLLPCVGLLTVDHNLPSNHIEHRILQAGASFCMEEAAVRCFTERMQGRPGFMPKYDREIVDEVTDYNMYLRERVFEKDLSFLEPGDVVPLPRFSSGELAIEKEQVAAICRQLGTDCFVVDLTHPVVKFPVVRVTIPRVSDTMLYTSPPFALLNELGRKQARIIESFFAARA